MSLRRTFIWLAVAPLGIGLTTGLTITTTLLTQQPIGLASEPLSAGDALAPRAPTVVAKGIRAHAAHPTVARVAHGGHAVATVVSSTHPASVTPAAPTPTPPPPAPAPPPPATTSTTKPAPAKQPTHTTVQVKPRTTKPAPTQTKTPADDHGGGDPQPSTDSSGSDNGGSDNSGPRVRDD